MRQRRTGFPDLAPLLRPQSVAVIGASDQPGNLGGVAIGLMKKFGYAGKIWPVNPKRSTVLGLPCFAAVGDLPEAADLAVIAVGAEQAIGVVRDCAAAGLRHGVVWAGGYAEVGEAGAARQAALVEACRETGFTVAGPNSVGIINAGSAMIATFASFLVEADKLIAGNIAMISQSGGFATMAQALALRRGVGFNLTVSAGNEAMLTVADYIHAVAIDDETKVIAAYIEGIRDGDRFIEAIAAARARGKRVVVLKGGHSPISAAAAAAHTGAFAGERRVWEAVAAEIGIIAVDSLEELLDVVLFLSRQDLAKLPKGRNVALVSFGGGIGVLSADQCDAHRLALPPLRPETRQRLAGLVTPIASINNPIDVTPQTFQNEKWFATFAEALDVIAADPGIDGILCQFGPQAQRGAETAMIISDLRQRTDKTVLLAWPLSPPGVAEFLADEGVHVFEDFARSISTFARLADNAEVVAQRRPPAALAFDWNAYVPSAFAGQVIAENECHRILSAAGVATAAGRLARSEEEAIAFANEIGFPLAAKGISSKVTHRAAAGLVVLDIKSADDLRVACHALFDRAKATGVALDGIYVQQMIKDGVEIIVSAFRDPVFGPMISCGWGGGFTEIINDVALARAPIDEDGAARLLQRLRIVAAAKKHEPDADLAVLARFVSHFSRLTAGVPWRKFVIELNPVKWSTSGAIAVDGLIIVDAP